MFQLLLLNFVPLKYRFKLSNIKIEANNVVKLRNSGVKKYFGLFARCKIFWIPRKNWKIRGLNMKYEPISKLKN